ncbi:transglycosylase SLT domain-containing protein [Bacillus sp. z60-11]|uniref:transglycosylase SLT domain-containing protein n=1 Tax=Bacillus sp. z60-11 TaxID=3377704 RepID=UPI00396C4EBE
MAKLTARFELEDRVSKKLRRIQKGFKNLEKRRKMLSRPLTVKVRADKAAKTLNKLHLTLKANLSSWQLKISAVDLASSTIQNISDQLQKNLPERFQFTISVHDQATAGIRKIKNMLSALASHEYTITTAVNDRVTGAVQKITGYMKATLQKGFTATLYVIDKVTKTVSRISSFISSHFAKEHQATLTLNDQATGKLQALRKKLNDIEAKKTIEVNAKVEKPGGESSEGKEEAIWTAILNAGKDKFVKWVEGLPEKIMDKSFDAVLGKFFKGEDGGGGCCCEGGGSLINEPATSSRPGSEESSPAGGRGSGRNPSGNGSGGRWKRGLKALGKGAGKLLPYAGVALSATELMDMNSENAGQKIGSAGGGIGGGLAGAAAGAALGTAILPVGGTAIGGAIGGIVGSMGGSSLGEYFGKMLDDNGGVMKTWDSIVKKSEKTWGKIQKTWEKVSDWFTDNVSDPISKAFDDALTWIQDTWSSITTWFQDNVWTPLIEPVVDFAIKVWEWFVQAWNWIQNTWNTVSTWFNDNVWIPFYNIAVRVINNVVGFFAVAWSVIQLVWGVASSWFMEYVWNPILGPAVQTAISIWNWLVKAWNWISETWSTVSTWFVENVWDPILVPAIHTATAIWDWLVKAWNWIQETWNTVSTWFIEYVWDPILKPVIKLAMDIWNKFEEAIENIKETWKGIDKWFHKLLDPVLDLAKEIGTAFKNAFGWAGDLWKKAQDFGGSVKDGWNNLIYGDNETAFEKIGKEKTGFERKKKPDTKATGGYITKPTISWIGEAGNEFVIPTQNNRGRGKMLLAQAATQLGMQVVDDIGSASADAGTVTPISSAASYSASVSPSMNAGGDVTNQASSFGQQFTDGFDEGLNSNVVSMEDWKQKNIQKPFNSLSTLSPTFGKNVVTGYAAGQNTTATGTDGLLQSKVKAPFQNTVNSASSWGVNTVKGFAAGQNSTPTGTNQFVSTHINKPFLDAKQSSSGWGTGMIGNFITGMNSKGSEVKEAAKELAKKVEQAFRDELDIHSPSRVMMSLGRFASVGIVKGLSSVDVKSFAEKQAGSLAAAFAGMGAVGGNVKDWLLKALMITGTPMSWLGPLSQMAMHESGGNPRAINLWDSNAQRGTPSKGLMQTIDPTFNAYKMKGLNDIWKPIHNAVAAINYIKARYGSVFNTPGMRSKRNGGGYRGYANGGLITNEQIARVGEGGKREWIIPEERGIRGRYLLQKAADALGMEVHDPASEPSGSISSGQAAAATTGQSRIEQPPAKGAKELNIYITGDHHYHNEQDHETLIAKIKRALVDELERDIHIGTKGSVAYD